MWWLELARGEPPVVAAVLYAMAGVMLVAAIVARSGLRPGIHAAPDARAGSGTAADAAAPTA
jgi:hypothetical protein